MLSKIEPLAVTASTLVNGCGRGAVATLNAIQAEKTGLRTDVYPDVAFPTWLGSVDGIEQYTIEAELSRFDCRNNRLAHLALSLDGFRDRLEAAMQLYGAHRIGVFVGTSTSGIEETEKAYRDMLTNGHDVLAEDFDLQNTQFISSLLGYVQRSLGLQGPGQSISTACSSSAKVFATAHRHIMSGLCDAAVVGGVDSLCLTTLYGFNSLQLVSDEICKPYDASRKGINIGEAAGFVLLERVDHGRDKIKIKGYGESSDAYHMSSPRPDGEGAAMAMQLALQRAGLRADEIDYLNLHGTATPSNDSAEGAGVAQVFAQAPLCSSTKGFTGHTLGAAGITEAIIAMLALEHDTVPANLNLEQDDTSIAIRPIRKTLSTPLVNVMSNNFGFGGSNCSLVFGW